MPRVLETYCPQAWTLLLSAGVSYTQWNTGRCEAVLPNTVAATANTELGGYEVFPVIDLPGTVAAIVGELGHIPRFE